MYHYTKVTFVRVCERACMREYEREYEREVTGSH